MQFQENIKIFYITYIFQNNNKCYYRKTLLINLISVQMYVIRYLEDNAAIIRLVIRNLFSNHVCIVYALECQHKYNVVIIFVHRISHICFTNLLCEVFISFVHILW